MSQVIELQTEQLNSDKMKASKHGGQHCFYSSFVKIALTHWVPRTSVDVLKKSSDECQGRLWTSQYHNSPWCHKKQHLEVGLSCFQLNGSESGTGSRQFYWSAVALNVLIRMHFKVHTSFYYLHLHCAALAGGHWGISWLNLNPTQQSNCSPSTKHLFLHYPNKISNESKMFQRGALQHAGHLFLDSHARIPVQRTGPGSHSLPRSAWTAHSALHGSPAKPRA